MWGLAAKSRPALATGLLGERREGRQIHYRVEPRGLAPLVDWLGHYGPFWRERFASLRTALKEMDDDV